MQSAQDLLLAKLALKTGLVTAEVLQDCFREQQVGSSRTQPPTLLQILVRRRVVSAENLLPITQAIERTSLDCARCRVRHPFGSVAGTALACPTCRGPLTIVREDGEMISERLSTGRRGTQRITTRADSARISRRSASEPAPKTFGPYEILGEVGRGGMGVVYKARHPQLDQVVALKVLIAGDMASKTQVRRFQREAELAGKLKHPNIVAIHDVGTIDDRHYFTMDFVEGVDLTNRIKTRDLPLRHGVEIARDLARAIGHAHASGVIHRDVKPANIIIDAQGRSHLMDFGLAREADAEESARLTREGSTVGTPFYMSPEQARGETAKVGPPTDIYSLGVVLFEMLTFERPFNANGQVELTRKILMDPPPRPTSLEPAIDPDVEAIVLKALEKEPKDRYPTADALADDLDRYLRGEPILARRARVAERTRSLTFALSALLVVAGLALAAYGLYLLHERHVAEEREAAEKEARDAAARELTRKREAAARSLKEAETAFAEADRVPLVTAAAAFFEKLHTSIERASECIKVDPSCARAFLLRGRAEEISRRLDAATADYAKARELEPAGASGLEAAYREARLMIRWKGDEKGACSRFAKIADGQGPPLWRTLARAALLLLDGKNATPDKILSEIEAAKRIDPTCPDVYLLSALFYDADPRTSREALQALDSCLDAERKNARAYALRAKIRDGIGQTDQAEDDLRHALALDPDEPLALIVRAAIDGERGNYGQAADEIRRALANQAGHEDPGALVFAITVYARANDLASARQAAARAAEIAPGRVESYLALANVLAAHDPQGAAAALSDGLDHCTDPAAQNSLAASYCQLLSSAGSIDQAIDFAKGHLAKNPEDPRRQNRLATLHAIRRQPGDTEAALALLDDLQARSPHFVDGYNTRFKLLIDLGRTKDLDDAIETLERNNPTDVRAWVIASAALVATARQQRGLEAAKKAVELDAQSPDANAQLAEVEFNLDRVDDAVGHARLAVERDPRSARALMILGVSSYRAKGPNPEAQRFLEGALQSSPDDVDAGYFLASMFYSAGKAAAAVKVAESVLRHAANAPARLWEILGIAQLTLEKPEEAEKALRRCLELDATSARAHAALGDALLRQGRKDDARIEVNEALRLDPKCEPALRLSHQLQQ